MVLVNQKWACPCCGAQLVVFGEQPDERFFQRKRGGRPRGSRNRPKQGQEEKAHTPAAELLPRKLKGEPAPKAGAAGQGVREVKGGE